MGVLVLTVIVQAGTGPTLFAQDPHEVPDPNCGLRTYAIGGQNPCHDNLVCTDDECIDGVCYNTPVKGICTSDGNVCTDDVCRGTECTHLPKDGFPCTDDNNPCTLDLCAGSTCSHLPNNGIACEDGDTCTKNDACMNGECVGIRFRDCSDDNFCTEDICFGDGCINPFNRRPCDDHDECTEDDTCRYGACTGTPIDCDDNNECSTEHDCDPVTTECSTWPMWPPLTNGCSRAGCFVTFNVPAWVPANNDDDNGNGRADWADPGPMASENDLVPATVSVSGCPPTDLSTWCDGVPHLRVVWGMHGLGSIGYIHGLFPAPDKTTWSSSAYEEWPIPGTFYIEGRRAVTACGSPARLTMGCYFASADYGWCGTDSDPIPSVEVAALTWRKVGNNPELFVPCPNNGGVGIFPGKTSPNDASASQRRLVALVATLDPPMANVPVHFRVWDVDDPFDQNNANMAIVDGNTTGPDNRPSGGSDPAVGSHQGVTNADGEATVLITVSMQPGNNYRAGASVLQDALTQATQADADALNSMPGGGNWSGYSVPLFWSEMLTVWRKLHVETDSMARPDISETRVVGTVASITRNSPAVGQSVVNLGLNLADDVSDLNAFEGGEIAFANCPLGSDAYPVLLSTSNLPGFSDTVTIAGVPGTCSTGSIFTLTDDDDIMVLPHFPSFGQLGVNAFAAAFVFPESAGASSQTIVGFDRHLDDYSIEYGFGPWDDGCTLSSSASYWACCVVGCWEPGENTDYDPDPCPAPAVPGSEGKDSGVTDDDSGTSAIFLQVIVDDRACTFTTDEPHVVTHEIVHTCDSHPDHVPQSIMDVGAPGQFDHFSAETINIIRSEIDW